MTAMENLLAKSSRYEIVGGDLIFYPADDELPAVTVERFTCPTIAELIAAVQSHVPVLDVTCGRAGCANRCRLVNGRATTYCSRLCQVREYNARRAARPVSYSPGPTTAPTNEGTDA